MDIPSKLPFLSAICCDLDDVHILDLNEMLNRYERGWENKGVLADLGGVEKIFLAEIAKKNGSWIQLDLTINEKDRIND